MTPPNKWTNYLDTSTYAGPTEILTALSSAWASYFSTYGEYPSVYATFGTIIYYGGY
jgi:hypothetical protein